MASATRTTMDYPPPCLSYNGCTTRLLPLVETGQRLLQTLQGVTSGTRHAKGGHGCGASMRAQGIAAGKVAQETCCEKEETGRRITGSATIPWQHNLVK